YVHHDGTATITDSTITQNAFLPGTNGYQKGSGVASRGTVVIARSDGSDSGDAAGQIDSQLWVEGSATVSDSTLSGVTNGGIHVWGSLALHNSTVTGTAMG